MSLFFRPAGLAGPCSLSYLELWLIADLCPESTPAAKAAVIAYRQMLPPAEEGPSGQGILTFEEHMVAINARLAPLRSEERRVGKEC